MTFFGLTEKQYELLNTLAIEPLKKANCKVWIFGSRVKGNFQKFSDIDILFEPSKDLELGFIYKITSELEDSNFPLKVDLVNIQNLASSYRDDVLKNRIQI
jgi:predicted nucleotidyltransferase